MVLDGFSEATLGVESNTDVSIYRLVLSPAQSPISFSMFESFSRGSILRLAKCPFFNPDHLFPFRDAVDEKNNDNNNKQRIVVS